MLNKKLTPEQLDSKAKTQSAKILSDFKEKKRITDTITRDDILEAMEGLTTREDILFSVQRLCENHGLDDHLTRKIMDDLESYQPYANAKIIR
jgi:hypothetical protein